MDNNRFNINEALDDLHKDMYKVYSTNDRIQSTDSYASEPYEEGKSARERLKERKARLEAEYKIRKTKFLKKVAAVGLALVVGGGYVGFVNYSNQKGFEEYREDNPDQTTYIVGDREMTAEEYQDYLNAKENYVDEYEQQLLDQTVADKAIAGEELTGADLSTVSHQARR